MNRSRWILTAAVAGALSFFCASSLWGKQGVVKTRDGRTLEGDITEKNDGLVVSVRGIQTNVARENVESVQYVGDVDQQYKEKLAQLPKNPTAADHIKIARWAFDNHAYEVARKEADAALAIDPNNSEATTLYQTINSQQRLEQMKVATPKTGGTTTPPPAKTTTTPPPGGDTHTAFLRKYLDQDQINAIRQAEWTADDKTVKVTFNNDVKRKYVATLAENASTFNALAPVEQARKILDNGTPEMRKDVKLLNDPATLAEYTRKIQPMVITGCAAAACHGGPNGGKFFLYSTPENEAATYTNFYLLSQVSATVGGERHLMLDRDYPDRSLLAEWSLPVDISKTSHPEVKGVAWRNMFRGKQDAGYQGLMRWLNKLQSPAPKYGFTFSLDGGAEKPAATSAPTGDAGGSANNPGGPNKTTKPATRPAVIPRVPPTDPGNTRPPAKQ
jgi:hypothetical protein